MHKDPGVKTYLFAKCEYFCTHCGQLRCSFTEKTFLCGNCSGSHIIIGELGSLDHEALKKIHCQNGPESR